LIELNHKVLLFFTLNLPGCLVRYALNW